MSLLYLLSYTENAIPLIYIVLQNCLYMTVKTSLVLEVVTPTVWLDKNTEKAQPRRGASTLKSVHTGYHVEKLVSCGTLVTV